MIRHVQMTRAATVSMESYMHYLKQITWLYSDVLFLGSTSIANQVSASVVVGRKGVFRTGLQINKAGVQNYLCSSLSDLSTGRYRTLCSKVKVF